jgi:hypothetical protein
LTTESNKVYKIQPMVNVCCPADSSRVEYLPLLR